MSPSKGMIYSAELLQIAYQISLLKGCLSELCPPSLSKIAQLIQRCSLKVRSLSLENTVLDTISLS